MKASEILETQSKAYDPKLNNILNMPIPFQCKNCGRYSHHSWECIHATSDDFLDEIKRSHQAEQWARNRAANFLQALRFEQLKNANLRNQLKKISRQTPC